jgi:hypothetical protein
LDGRRAKRLRILASALEQLHLQGLTATSPNIEGRIKLLLSPLLLSRSAETEYLSALVKLLQLELKNPGRRVDLSTGIVELVTVTDAVDEQGRVSATTVVTVQQAQA